MLKLLIVLTIISSTHNCVGWEYTLFDVSDTKPKSKPIALTEGSDSTYIRPNGKGHGKFTLIGNAGAGARWFIPINMRISTECKVYFDLSSTNVRTTQNKSNLNLVLKSPQPHSRNNTESTRKGSIENTLIRKEISIFKSAGSKDSAIGWIDINELKESVYIEGFYFDFELIDCCEGDLTVTDLRIISEGNLLSWEEVDDILSYPPPVKAKIKTNESGDLVISVNGVEQNGLGYSSGNQTHHSQYGALISECNLSLTRTLINFGGESPYFTQHKPVWIHPGYIDFHRIDQVLKKACLNRNAYVIVDILFHGPPAWWIKKQGSGDKSANDTRFKRDTISVPGTASPDDVTEIRNNENSGKFLVSDLDPSWKKYCQDALKQLLAYVRKRPYASNIIGCNVISGIGMNDYPYSDRDRHPGYVKSFQGWLSTKYRDLRTLRKSWANESVEFNTIIPAAKEDWNKGDIFSFVHPARRKKAFESQSFYQESWTDTLLSHCQLIKSLTHRHYITGVIGGPGLIFNSLWNNSYQPLANAVNPILKSKDVDYVEVPVDSMDLRNGSGANGMESILGDELHKHNKLLFLRNQIPFSSSTQSLPFISSNIQDLIQIQRRIFAASLTNNVQLFFFQTSAREYKDATVKKEINQFQIISGKALKLTKRKHAEIAFVVDLDTFKYLAPDSSRSLVTAKDFGVPILPTSEVAYHSPNASSYFHLLGTPRLLWNRMGVPYDVVSIDSFEPGSYRSIVLYHTIFLNKERENLINQSKHGGRYIVSTWANGFVTDRYLSPVGMEKITGIPIRMSPKRTQFNSKVQPELEKFLSADIKSSSIGWLYVHRQPTPSSNNTFGPTFHIDVDQAPILAKYTDGGSASLAIKDFADWTSIYSASPIIYPEIMREILRRSQAHIYLDSNDLVYINDSFIGIHTLESGIKKLHLPEASPLYEVFREYEVIKSKIHRLKLEGKRTYLFYRGDKKTWDSL